MAAPFPLRLSVCQGKGEEINYYIIFLFTFISRKRYKMFFTYIICKILDFAKKEKREVFRTILL